MREKLEKIQDVAERHGSITKLTSIVLHENLKNLYDQLIDDEDKEYFETVENIIDGRTESDEAGMGWAVGKPKGYTLEDKRIEDEKNKKILEKIKSDAKIKIINKKVRIFLGKMWIEIEEEKNGKRPDNDDDDVAIS